MTVACSVGAFLREGALAPVDTAARERSVPTRGFYAIRNATVHPMSGAVLKGATVVIRDGRIEAVGTNVPIPRNAPVYDAKGLHPYPGLIDASTTLGLTEIGSIAATIDTTETGSFNPNVRAEIAINPESELIPVARVAGITTAVSAPTGGILSGMGCVMNLDGWTWEQRVLKLPIELYNFPEPSGDAAQSAEARRRAWETRMRPVKEFLEHARCYMRAHSAEGQTGVFCIASSDSRNVCNLPYHGATAVEHGLPYEEELKSITLYPARTLGWEHRWGTIEPGKDANLMLTTGTPLDIRTQGVQGWIEGRPVEMTSKHIRLDERYRKRPKE